MPAGLWLAVHGNVPTREKMEALSHSLSNITHAEKQIVLNFINTPLLIRDLLGNRLTAIPQAPLSIVKTLKDCVSHLFDGTAKLVAVETACNDRLINFFHRYSADYPVGNGIVCGFCGSAELSQWRQGIPDGEQWRSDFDHFLSESGYPLIALDSDNLIPACHFCNSKAKRNKDVLFDSKGVRRLCFDPWAECAAQQLSMSFVKSTQEIVSSIEVTFAPNSPDDAERLGTWDDVYQIKSRIAGHFSSMHIVLQGMLDFESLDEFKGSIAKYAANKEDFWRRRAYNYWYWLLCISLTSLDDQHLNALREVCAQVYQNEVPLCDANYGDLIAQQLQ